MEVGPEATPRNRKAIFKGFLEQGRRGPGLPLVVIPVSSPSAVFPASLELEQ